MLSRILFNLTLARPGALMLEQWRERSTCMVFRQTRVCSLTVRSVSQLDFNSANSI